MEQIVKLYEEYLIIDKSFSKNTISKYLTNVSFFLAYLKEFNLDLFNLEYDDILDYLTYLKVDKKLKPSSINNNISALKSFFKFLKLEKYISVNVLDKIILNKTPNKKVTFLTIEEMERLLDSVGIDKFNSFQDLAIIELLYSSGIRVSELVNIKLGDIDGKDYRLKVHGKGDKERVVLINKNVTYYLQKYIDGLRKRSISDSSYLFINKKGYPLTRFSVYNIIRNHAIRANISKEVSPHTLRHTFATHLVNNSADILSVKYLLGHSKVSTSEKYTHLGGKDLKNKYDLIMEKGEDNEI